MTYRVSEKYSSTTVLKSEKNTDKLTSDVLFTLTLINQEVQILTTIYSYALPAEYKEILSKLSHKEKE
jgi:flagellar motor switch protein FliG